MVKRQYIMNGVYLEKDNLGSIRIFFTDIGGHEMNTIFISRQMLIHILKFMDEWEEE